MRFRAKVRINGINPYVAVSPKQARALRPGWRRPMPVLVRINGRPSPPWRINMMPMGNGGFFLYLHGQVRKASGAELGDRVMVDARFDHRYKSGPMHPMPAWFRASLEKNPRARQSWRKLTPSRKKEILRYFSRLKSAEACRRNAAKAVSVLSGRAGRFMARSWEGGK